MSNISSIDDLLMGVGNSQQPATPEHKEKTQEKPDPVEEMESDDEDLKDDANYDSDDETEDNKSDPSDDSDDDDEAKEDKKPDAEEGNTEPEIDEYGNEKPRISKGMKERLDRKDRQYQQEMAQRDHEISQLRSQLANQGASKEVQQAVKDFKYDPSEEVSWEKQLSDFVKSTVNNMHSEQQQDQRQAQERDQERAFQQKFTQGMDRFTDFREVVGKLPMDNDMTRALRGMSDPTAFIYAAAKRQSGEIERIAKLPDPYARMVEMGKLEERMRRNKTTTKAPRPLGRVKEDATARVTPKQKDATGDDLLAKADAKRLANVRNRHKSNR